MYLALEASEPLATRFVDSIKSRFGKLKNAPLSGAPRDHFAPGLRAIFFRKYAIYYLAGAKQIIVVRILHGARDAAAIVEHGGFSSEEHS
jgi:toxin ParE1/3/4